MTRHTRSSGVTPQTGKRNSLPMKCETSNKMVPLMCLPKVHKANMPMRPIETFSEEIRKCTLEEDEELRSFDVSALFTSIPIDEALTVVEEKLKADTTLASRTSLSS